jgi:hypothetical protein
MSDQPLDLNTTSTAIGSIVNITIMDTEKSGEPLTKKQKLAQSLATAECTTNNKKLEDRLGCILLCCVCLDGSKSSIYQVFINIY